MSQVFEKVVEVLKELPINRNQSEHQYRVLPELSEIERETGTKIECYCFKENEPHVEKYVGKERAEAMENNPTTLQTLYNFVRTFNKLNGHQGDTLEFSLINDEKELAVRAYLPGATGSYSIIAVEKEAEQRENGKPYMKVTKVGLPKDEKDEDIYNIAAPIAAIMNTLKGHTEYKEARIGDYTIREEEGCYVLYGPE